MDNNYTTYLKTLFRDFQEFFSLMGHDSCNNDNDGNNVTKIYIKKRILRLLSFPN